MRDSLLSACPSTRDLRDKWVENVTEREIMEVVEDRRGIISEIVQRVGRYLWEVRERRGKALAVSDKNEETAQSEPSV